MHRGNATAAERLSSRPLIGRLSGMESGAVGGTSSVGLRGGFAEGTPPAIPRQPAAGNEGHDQHPHANT